MRRTKTKTKLTLENAAGVALSTLARMSIRPKRRSGHILVAGPGGGSVGDEAMYRAFLQAAPRPLTVVAREAGDLLEKPEEDSVTVVLLGDLLYGPSAKHLADLWRLLRLARRSATVSLIGADTMDGVYNETSSVRRFRVAQHTSRVGASSSVLGFSWNSRPGALALAAMKASDASVRLLARDGESAARLRADGARTVEEVADLAFLTMPDRRDVDPELDSWIARQAEDDRRVFVVNANPRLETKFPGQFDQYVRLIHELTARGDAVVLLPHDSRGADGEEAYIDEIATAVGEGPRLFHVRRILSPDRIVALARQADFVVSGRMHLVILASVGDAPTLGLEYQDKFSGLYRLLGYDGAVRADEDGNWDLVEATKRASDRADESRKAWALAKPRVLELARMNVPR